VIAKGSQGLARAYALIVSNEKSSDSDTMVYRRQKKIKNHFYETWRLTPGTTEDEIRFTKLLSRIIVPNRPCRRNFPFPIYNIIYNNNNNNNIVHCERFVCFFGITSVIPLHYIHIYTSIYTYMYYIRSKNYLKPSTVL